MDDDDLSDLLASPAEVRAMFEAYVGEYLGMTGDEFIAAWLAGRWPNPDGDIEKGIPYEPHVEWAATFLPALGVAV